LKILKSRSGADDHSATHGCEATLMSDTLQLVVTRHRFKLKGIAQANVRYASACREMGQI
jgi:hypothetical protein